ncbi:hypothetical protein, partial [Streptococcus pneumoniae]|uniref:hypothetical protein n=1 Tax=Streptococcus pneumoniae TaxID=1313 RepID=UPI001E37D5D8
PGSPGARPAPGDPGNSGPTAATTVVDALSDGLERLEGRQTPGNRGAFIGDSLMVYGPTAWTVTDQITCWPLWASVMT